MAGNPPHEYPVFLAVIVRFDAHDVLHWAIIIRFRPRRTASRSMIVAAMPAMRPSVGVARVLAEYQGLDRDGNGLRGHANAPQVDVVEIPEDDPVDDEDFTFDTHFIAQD